MGQTEAPLIIKPYVPRMTQSELLTMMVGGMAHVSGGIMAVYIGLGADPVVLARPQLFDEVRDLLLAPGYRRRQRKAQRRGEQQRREEPGHAASHDTR